MNDWQGVSSRLGGISRSTIFALWASGALASVTIGKRRFSTDKQIEEYIERLESAGGAA